MAENMRSQAKDRQRNEIRMLQIKKLQEVNKFQKTDNTRLISENSLLTDQCSKLKTLMIEYEYESLQQRIESNVSVKYTQLIFCFSTSSKSLLKRMTVWRGSCLFITTLTPQ